MFVKWLLVAVRVKASFPEAPVKSLFMSHWPTWAWAGPSFEPIIGWGGKIAVTRPVLLKC